MASSRPVIIERSRSSSGVEPVPSPRHGALSHRAPTTTKHTPERAPKRAPDGWSLDSLTGRFLEITSDGQTVSLTAAASLILESQLRGEPAAWVSVGDSTFYPPDFAAWGIDLASLPVVRLRHGIAASRAADRLVRSGSFGVIVLDLGRDVDMHIAVHARLAALAKKHHTIVVCLTQKGPEVPSLGPLVSLRARGRFCKTGFDRFTWELDVSRDKRRGVGWRQLLVKRHPEWKDVPAVVVEKDKPQGVILWVNKQALRRRILPGLRYAKGLSLSSDLRAGVVSNGEIEDHITQLAELFRFYTPHVEPSTREPGVFWLDASGLSLLHPSLGKWAGLVGADLTKLGFYW
jgi:recombination protein RecA